MSADKIRIRKSILPKVKQWCEALEVSESEFAHEALTHYIRFLSGKPTGSNIVEFSSVEQLEEIDANDFDGGIAL
ncbi:hypothetical protein NIES4106_61030 (plasmid) [Fischerella sp. NIES-4106]|nr:hypothetical protein NIES4106_61030 [Fischerella sp. NIES-4106]